MLLRADEPTLKRSIVSPAAAEEEWMCQMAAHAVSRSFGKLVAANENLPATPVRSTRAYQSLLPKSSTTTHTRVVWCLFLDAE